MTDQEYKGMKETVDKFTKLDKESNDVSNFNAFIGDAKLKVSNSAVRFAIVVTMKECNFNQQSDSISISEDDPEFQMIRGILIKKSTRLQEEKEKLKYEFKGDI